MEHPFEEKETLTPKDAIEIFLKGYENTPTDQWELLVWPKVKFVNGSLIDEKELRDIYDYYLDIVKQAQRNEQEEIILDLFKKNPKEGTFKLAEYIVSKYNIITIGEKEREMFIYKDGMYYPGAENLIIFPEIQRILKHFVNKSAKNETHHKIADMTSQHRSIFSITSVNFIPLKNGVYDFETKNLLPHSPHYRFTYQFPINYDPKSICPKTLTFFNQVLSPEQMLTIQEWIGYYFHRLYSFKKAIIFVGEGDTGKTTFLEVITHLLGRENISSISLQKMSSDKFSAANLYEKHGNLVDELSARDISDTGSFKVATGGGSVTGEYKFGNQFSFHNFSKFTFACNKIPDVTDMDDLAYFNRWMVIRFEKTIENKIPNFIQSLTTDEERSGLFSWAMEGLKRLLERGSFSYVSSAMDTKREMMRSGSSIAMFCAEELYQEVGFEMSKEDMYDAYTKFCIENGLAAETIKMFGTKFLFYVSYASDGLIYDKEHPQGKRVRGWRNVAVKASEEDKKANEELESLETKVQIL